MKNTVSEVREYKEVDGKIIITCLVNSVEADFVLDLAGQTAILPEYVEKFNIMIRPRRRKSRMIVSNTRISRPFVQFL